MYKASGKEIEIENQSLLLILQTQTDELYSNRLGVKRHNAVFSQLCLGSLQKTPNKRCTKKYLEVKVEVLVNSSYSAVSLFSYCLFHAARQIHNTISAN